MARRIFRGQLALRALKAVQKSELLTPPQTECIKELLEDNTAKFLLDNYPTPLKKPGIHANEKRPFLSVADRYIQWVEKKLNPASRQEVIMTQLEFASHGLGSFKEMVEGNLRLVVSIAKKCYALNMSLLDKVSYGNEALMESVAGFDFRMENRFSTFAERKIRWQVWRGIKESDDMVTIPSSVQRAYLRSRRQCGQDGTKSPEMQLIQALKNPRYLGEEFGDSIPDPAPDLSEAVTTRVNSEDQVERLLPKLLKCLTRRELTTIRQYYCLDGGSGITLKEIGKNQGSLTSERIRQILAKALRKMRDAAENGLPGVDKPDNHQSARFTLTPRQVQVLQCAVDGLSNQQIADLLNISTVTIKIHMHAIYQAAAVFDGVPKTNFRRVVNLATQKGFIQLPEGQVITNRVKAKENHTPAKTA